MSTPLDVELLKQLMNWKHTDYFNNPLNWQVNQATFYYFSAWNKNDGQWGYAIVIPYIQNNTGYVSVTKIIGTDGRIEQYISGPNSDNNLYMHGRVAWLSDLPDLSTYAKKTDIPNVSNFVTMAQVTAEVTRVLTTAEF